MKALPRNLASQSVMGITAAAPEVPLFDHQTGDMIIILFSINSIFNFVARPNIREAEEEEPRYILAELPKKKVGLNLISSHIPEEEFKDGDDDDSGG